MKTSSWMASSSIGGLVSKSFLENIRENVVVFRCLTRRTCHYLKLFVKMQWFHRFSRRWPILNLYEPYSLDPLFVHSLIYNLQFILTVKNSRRKKKSSYLWHLIRGQKYLIHGHQWIRQFANCIHLTEEDSWKLNNGLCLHLWFDEFTLCPIKYFESTRFCLQSIDS